MKQNLAEIWLFLTIEAVNNDIKSKINFCRQPFSEQLWTFHVLQTFLFTTSEAIHDYCL